MTIYVNQSVCTAPVKLWGWIPTPFICATNCHLVDNKSRWRCPKCGMLRPAVRQKFGVA